MFFECSIHKLKGTISKYFPGNDHISPAKALVSGLFLFTGGIWHIDLLGTYIMGISGSTIGTLFHGKIGPLTIDR